MLPAKWYTLPGPSEFLNCILHDLRDGCAVWIYFPKAPKLFASYIGSEIKSMGFPKQVTLAGVAEMNSLRSGGSTVYSHEVGCEEMRVAPVLRWSPLLRTLNRPVSWYGFGFCVGRILIKL